MCVCVCVWVGGGVHTHTHTHARICRINNFPKPPVCCFLPLFVDNLLLLVWMCACVSPCFLSPCCFLPLFGFVQFWTRFCIVANIIYFGALSNYTDYYVLLQSTDYVPVICVLSVSYRGGSGP